MPRDTHIRHNGPKGRHKHRKNEEGGKIRKTPRNKEPQEPGLDRDSTIPL